VDDFLMGSPFITWNPGNTAAEIARRMDMGEIGCLDDLTDLVDAVFQRYASAGGKAVKVAMAYSRSLQFRGASRAEAGYQLGRVLAGAFGPNTEKVSDFMLHYCIGRAIHYDLPIQIHTGMQDGNGTWTWLERARPTHLTNLFIWYPEARFVVLHAGFPFTGEAGVLAKTFPNVYLDFAWVPLLSPTGATDALSQWLEMVPGNKIMWGGDVHTVEELYGAVLALKDVLRTVLARKVEDGYLTVDHAAALARAIMADNAARLFGLDVQPQAAERNESG
jgi:predicted TIM-barrel fold metal-dependent hydrolase